MDTQKSFPVLAFIALLVGIGAIGGGIWGYMRLQTQITAQHDQIASLQKSLEDGTMVENQMQKILNDSLTVAREKGLNAAIKGNLAGIRIQAELYWDEHDTYAKNSLPAGPCYSGTKVTNSILDEKSIQNALTSVEQSNNNAGLVCSLTGGKESSYAISAKLIGQAKWWCVDSTGASREIDGPITASVCK